MISDWHSNLVLRENMARRKEPLGYDYHATTKSYMINA
jgi:hypothetical protein